MSSPTFGHRHIARCTHSYHNLHSRHIVDFRRIVGRPNFAPKFRLFLTLLVWWIPPINSQPTFLPNLRLQILAQLQWASS